MTDAQQREVKELVRRELSAQLRSPALNSQMSPRGVTSARVATRVVRTLPRAAQEFDTVYLDGDLITEWVYLSGSWRQVADFDYGYGTAFPSAPRDGELFFYDPGSAGEVWTFRYNANGSVSYPWEFVGGTELRAEVSGSLGTTGSATYVDLGVTGPIVTVPLAGDYKCQFAWNASHNVASAFGVAAVKVGGATALDSNGVFGQNGAANTNWNVTGRIKLSGLSASTALKLQFRSGSGATMSVGNTVNHPIYLEAIPIRVAG